VFSVLRAVGLRFMEDWPTVGPGQVLVNMSLFGEQVLPEKVALGKPDQSDPGTNLVWTFL
jgi:hypothetical protein